MEIKTVGIIGAGQMGSGIAQVCAVAGLNVILNDVNEAAIARGIAGIASNLERMVAKQKLSADDRDAALARIRGAVQVEELAPAGFLIEAATENLEIKQKILQGVERIASRDSIIATNTSSVSITKLAKSLEHADRFIGMHFFNPVPVMGLVEVISGVQTGEQALAETLALAKRLDKTPIAVKNAPGFVVNRILVPMINEAIFVLQEGLASAEDIDNGMKQGTNQPIGPLALADLIGLDTVLSIMEVFYRDFGDTKYRPAQLLKEMVDAGRLGRKTKRGFYQY
ncbi:3-hydroxybutyryl-CoA dehydrogenase [Noviherbaspirillum denitrificans]|uniref:3-hydroxybutyryl-CoA dehydrogenase n=1 Tax=Noviherbaspirillum denitrificans TaxID=1968433 RepID=A0A254TH97_9BURK|nr:3-hydroxybutyryl-CoA dehydrogenase [Noviherbaspirillum denitrificans]OWW21547.1 3-hydroxybutyryl-CoA dehydrogenase [Noviherbaspirillum denitrificans]